MFSVSLFRQAARTSVRSFQALKGQNSPRVFTSAYSTAQASGATSENQYTETIRDFLDPAEFYNAIRKNDIDFFAGVPDSLLKDFCAYVTANTSNKKHVITANEGNAIALAAGHHFATGKAACVYLQNSGLGNIINPLMSLAAPEVYSVPMLMLIGWRGEPGKKDEPQHLVQGQATPALLASLNIPFQVLPDFQEGAEKVLRTASEYMHENQGPYAILVRRQTFVPYKLPSEEPKFELNREGALKLVVDSLGEKDVVIGTTGMLSRELFEYRVALKHGHEKDFLTVGSMGHASSIALGIALEKPNRKVYCLDGDGAMLMHMGATATVAHVEQKNFKHVLINNGAHDSVGGQPTNALQDDFSFTRIAEGMGYKWTATASTSDEIKAKLAELQNVEGPAMLEIYVNKGGRKDLGRPTRTPIQNKEDFMAFLAEE